MTSLREQIAALDDREYLTVSDIPGWAGITVALRNLSAQEGDEFALSVEKAGDDPEKLSLVRARLVALCMVDPETHEQLAPGEDGVRMIGGKSNKAVNHLFQICQDVNKLERKAVEEAVKN